MNKFARRDIERALRKHPHFRRTSDLEINVLIDATKEMLTFAWNDGYAAYSNALATGKRKRNPYEETLD